MSVQGSCLCHSTFNVSHYSESNTQQAGGSAQDAALTEVREEDAPKICTAVTHIAYCIFISLPLNFWNGKGVLRVAASCHLKLRCVCVCCQLVLLSGEVQRLRHQVTASPALHCPWRRALICCSHYRNMLLILRSLFLFHLSPFLLLT